MEALARAGDLPVPAGQEVSLHDGTQDPAGAAGGSGAASQRPAVGRAAPRHPDRLEARRRDRELLAQPDRPALGAALVGFRGRRDGLSVSRLPRADHGRGAGSVPGDGGASPALGCRSGDGSAGERLRGRPSGTRDQDGRAGGSLVRGGHFRADASRAAGPALPSHQRPGAAALRPSPSADHRVAGHGGGGHRRRRRAGSGQSRDHPGGTGHRRRRADPQRAGGV